MNDFDDIYQQVILDHNRSPRNFGELENANRRAEGYNPLCGDKISIQLRLTDGEVESIAFQGQGCAICMASASIMTESLKGKSVVEAEGLVNRFQQFLIARECPLLHGEPSLGKLEVFRGVREFPMRIKCATLPWHTCRAAIHGEEEPVSTE